jgi:hypothetical protein
VRLARQAAIRRCRVSNCSACVMLVMSDRPGSFGCEACAAGPAVERQLVRQAAPGRRQVSVTVVCIVCAAPAAPGCLHLLWLLFIKGHVRLEPLSHDSWQGKLQLEDVKCVSAQLVKGHTCSMRTVVEAQDLV